MRQFYIVLLLLLCYFSPVAQSTFTITGTVTDTTGQPLAYVSLRIDRTGTGTATNKAGRFSLALPQASLSDTLLFSCMGYSEQKVPVKNSTGGNMIVQLQPRIQLMEEVTVKPLNPVALLQEAIARIPDNYYNRPHITHGFYRIDTKKGEEHIMLSEAVFDICNYGYTSERNNIFRLTKMRSVQDEQASHGIDLGLKPKGLYDFDIVREIGSSALLNKKGLKNHLFRLHRITRFNGRDAYEISFDQREGIRESLYKGKIFLEVNSLAIMGVQLTKSPRGIGYAKYGNAAERALLKVIGMNIDLKKEDSWITYQQYGDKWVLANVRNDNILHFKSNRQYYDFPADIRVDYIITGVDTTGVDAFAGSNMGNNKLIEQQTNAYEKDFWKEHTILLADYNSDTIAATMQARNEQFSIRTRLKKELKRFPKDPAARMDSILAYYHREGGFSGSALVKYKGVLLLRKGYGVADKQTGMPATDTTQYRIGSLTKTFTSALIMQLAAEDKLQLTDSLYQYLPGYTHKNITLQQLLTHTSGIPSYTNDAASLTGILDSSYTITEMLDRYANDSLEFAPGSQFHYSNTGYLVLAAVIEKVTGQSFASSLQTRIFDRLGMKQTVFGNRALNSKGYWMGAPEYAYNPANMAGAAGIASTVNDLLLWDEALYGSQVLAQASVQESIKPRADYADWDAWYGYGWMIDRKLFRQSKKYTIVYHPGTDMGYYTMFLRIPETNTLIVLLNNTGDFPRFDITGLLLDEMDK